MKSNTEAGTTNDSVIAGMFPTIANSETRPTRIGPTLPPRRRRKTPTSKRMANTASGGITIVARTCTTT
jgi:hypothetical protein